MAAEPAIVRNMEETAVEAAGVVQEAIVAKLEQAKSATLRPDTSVEPPTPEEIRALDEVLAQAEAGRL